MKTHILKIVAILAIVGGPVLSWAQSPSVIRDRSTQTANAFLDAVDLSSTKYRPASFSSDGKLVTVHFGNEVKVTVDTVKNIVVSFRNYARLQEQLSIGARRGGYTLTSEQQVRQRAIRLKNDLRLPANYDLEGVRLFGRNDPRIADTNKEGAASGSFAPRPNGYRFFSYGVQVLFVLDPLDGTLVSYDRFDDSVIESSTLSLNKVQALAAAKRVAASVGSAVNAARPPELGYTLPNGLYGGTSSPAVAPYKLRLAWQIPIKGKTLGVVWVDAANGRILGGWYRRRPG